MLEQLPADVGALSILAGALGWALTELRAHRQHRAAIDRERVDLEKERLEIERARASALEDLSEEASRGVDHLEQLERTAQEIHPGP